MTRLHQLFSIDELEKLDQKQLEILRDMLVHEMRSNSQIHDILKGQLRPAYTQMTSQGSQAGSGGAQRQPP